ncbi:MAG: aldo/keto reductase [Myxococcales bacterium]|nr:aldo/keto reductase [Myxococcales bacterium]
MSHDITVRGGRAPSFMYGTAWKEERTEALTRMALAAGFRAIDTANQRKHYAEASVGAAVKASGIPRGELFLQTKFTSTRGQDHRLPYDRAADLATQVRQSFASSCEHLGVEYLDSYVLHGPWSDLGWGEKDRQAWGAMEALHETRAARLIGVSNVSLSQLVALCDEATVAPAFVQNRCYARDGWDHEVRACCLDRGIVYQGFSLLTANRRELSGPIAAAIATRVGATVPQVVFRFAMAVGMLPLTGTSDRQHMEQDLASAAITLDPGDIAAIEGIATSL